MSSTDPFRDPAVDEEVVETRTTTSAPVEQRVVRRRYGPVGDRAGESSDSSS